MARGGFILPVRLCPPLPRARPSFPATCTSAMSSALPSIPPNRAARARPWVGAHSLHNALLNNHLLDLLDLHAARLRVMSDVKLPGYDPAGSHALRMRKLGKEFRRQVVGAFARHVGLAHVTCIAPDAVRGPATAEREGTKHAMRERKHIIVGAVVADEERRLIGRIPMLLRADIAVALLDIELDTVAEMDRVYVAVGVKRRPVETNRNGDIRFNSLGRVQSELWLLNHLLANEQGCDLGVALLVGLHPKRKKAIQLGAWLNKGPEKPEPGKPQSLFDETVWRVVRVPFGGAECSKGIAALEALAWHVAVVDDGEAWIADAEERARKQESGDVDVLVHLVLGKNDQRLRPNMKCASMYDAPWSKAKRKLAESLRELTLVSGVSYSMTGAAMEKGLPNDYADPRITAATLGVASQYTKTILEMCKASYDGPVVKPAIIPHNRFNWRRLQGFKENDHLRFDKWAPELPFADARTFFVDLELASPEYLCTSEAIRRDGSAVGVGDLERFFDVEPSLPMQDDSTTEALVFMIGCGQVVNGEWRHRVFTARALTRTGESAVLREWLEHMNERVPAGAGPPILNVWGPEQQLLRKAMRRMATEDAEAVKEKRTFKMVNVLQVVTTGCVTVRGNLSNSLKAVCATLDELGLLDHFEQRGEEEIVGNGADAMALGLDSAEVAIREELGELAEAPKMRQVARYNEADCRDIARVITYLRRHH